MNRSLIQRTDWRWANAAEAAEYTRSQAPYHLRDQDDLVRDACSFKRAVDKGFDADDWPLVADAYELFSSQPSMKLQVECLLLGGAETAMIAKLTGLPADVIQVYHDLFFDVRGRPPMWICTALFQGCFVDVDERDKVGIQHRLAYMLRWEAFAAIQGGALTEAARAKVMAVARDLLTQQLLNTVLVHGSNPEVLARLAAASAGAQAAKQATPATEGDEGYGRAVIEFLRSVPLQVADPDDPTLNSSAREPRAHITLRDALDPPRNES